MYMVISNSTTATDGTSAQHVCAQHSPTNAELIPHTGWKSHVENMIPEMKDASSVLQ